MTTKTRAITLLVSLALALTLPACGDDAADEPDVRANRAVIDPGDGGDYRPELDPAGFAPAVDNPWYPLVPGTTKVFEGDRERVEIEVLAETRQVMGITATVVLDRTYEDGELVEETYDWFAQDAAGNVWYLGEDTREFVDGEAVNTNGAWEAGVDGALPGIVMLAEPAVGEAYRQEYFAGEAEDMGEVIRVDETLVVGGVTYTDVVVTRDWSPLEPEVIEEKYFAAGVGEIRAVKVAGGKGGEDLVEIRLP
jgi:hypothetical protein